MSNVRFARGLVMFALFLGTAGTAAAQQAQAGPQDQQLIEQGPLPGDGDPLEALPGQGDGVLPGPDQSDVAEAGGAAAAARAEMTERFGVDELAPGQFRWADSIPREGQTRIVISLSDQMAFVYRGDTMIGAATVSSGKTDHETPTGVFPILAKNKVHRSRTYDNAPMPFMQRLNVFGVALHGGSIPGYPASHGCVRLPMKFAERLFSLTTTGSEVVITA